LQQSVETDQSQIIIIIIIWRAPRPCGASPTQPYKCGQYFKVKVKINVVVDVDFNILTAFIRLGRAGPVGAGCPPEL
jgi:hypothetical protein